MSMLKLPHPISFSTQNQVILAWTQLCFISSTHWRGKCCQDRQTDRWSNLGLRVAAELTIRSQYYKHSDWKNAILHLDYGWCRTVKYECLPWLQAKRVFSFLYKPQYGEPQDKLKEIHPSNTPILSHVPCIWKRHTPRNSRGGTSQTVWDAWPEHNWQCHPIVCQKPSDRCIEESPRSGLLYF